MAQITKETIINDVLKLDQSTARIFLSHGLFCLGCPHAAAESIEQAGQVHGIDDIDALVNDLNEHLKNL